MWLTFGILLVIVIVGGAAELLIERASERYRDDDRADLRPGFSGWLGVLLGPPIALGLLLVSFAMAEKAWTAAQPLQLIVTFATVGAIVALALYFLWASYVTAFHRLRWDGKIISRSTLFHRQNFPMSLVKQVRGNRFYHRVDFVDGARWYLPPLRGISRLFGTSS